MQVPPHDITPPTGDAVIPTISVEDYDRIKVEVLQVFIMDEMIRKLARLLDPSCTDEERQQIGLDYQHYLRDQWAHLRFMS